MRGTKRLQDRGRMGHCTNCGAKLDDEGFSSEGQIECCLRPDQADREVAEDLDAGVVRCRDRFVNAYLPVKQVRIERGEVPPTTGELNDAQD